MSIRTFSTSILAGALFLAASSTQAISLVDTLASAMKTQSLSAKKQAGEKLADDVHTSAHAWLSDTPSVSLMYKTDETTNDTGYREWEAMLDLPVWRWGQKDSLQTYAGETRNAMQSTYDFALWSLSQEMIDSAWQLRLAELDKFLSEAQLQAALKLEQDVKRRFEAGELARTDFLLAQQNTLDRAQQSRASNLVWEQQRAAWKSFTGTEQLPDDLDWKKQPEQPVENHPAYRLAQHQLGAARAKAENEKYRVKGSPVVSLYARRDRASQVDDWNEAVGLQLTVPFGESTSAGARAEFELAASEAKLKLSRVMREIKLKRETAQLSLTQSADTLKLAQTSAELANQRLNMLTRAFALGETALFNLLQAREQAALADSKLAQEQVNYQRAVSRFNSSLGVIPQ